MSMNFAPPPGQEGYWIQQPTVVPVRTPHGIHLAITVCTLGFWLPIWIIHALLNAGRTQLKPVPVWVPTPGVTHAPQPAPQSPKAV